MDLINNFQAIDNISKRLQEKNIELSVFIDPNMLQIKMAKSLGAQWVELHTGSYANIYAMLFSNLKNTPHCIKELDLPRDELHIKLQKSLQELEESTKLAYELELKVAAGHGLNYQNVKNIVDIENIIELNIGQSIIARSVFSGFENAVLEMKQLCKR